MIDMTWLLSDYRRLRLLMDISRVGDANLAGNVGFADLLAVARNYGKVVSAEQMAGFEPAFAADVEAAFGQVPEPHGAGVVAATLLTVLGRRRGILRRSRVLVN